MTGITPEGFEIDRDFAAPPSAVFAAWTTVEHFARWFGGKDVQIPADRLDYEPTAGRAWSATMVLPDGNTIDWTGEFLEVVPDRRLVLTMTDQPGEPGRLAITVENPGGAVSPSARPAGLRDAPRARLTRGGHRLRDDLATAAIGCPRRRSRRCWCRGCRKSQQNYSHSQPDLGSAVAGWHAPSRRHRREVAGLTIMNDSRCRVCPEPREGRSTRGPACT
jgi:uncharacterized protein YndB with AHSA1/START domain